MIAVVGGVVVLCIILIAVLMMMGDQSSPAPAPSPAQGDTYDPDTAGQTVPVPEKVEPRPTAAPKAAEPDQPSIVSQHFTF